MSIKPYWGRVKDAALHAPGSLEELNAACHLRDETGWSLVVIYHDIAAVREGRLERWCVGQV